MKKWGIFLRYQKKRNLFNPKNPWISNTAIAQLLFANKTKFHKFFPQYSIDQVAPLPYSYSNNLNMPRSFNPNMNNFAPRQNLGVINQNQNVKPTITLEEEMELFGIQNDCVRVKAYDDTANHLP